jgi:hypothetical protein
MRNDESSREQDVEKGKVMRPSVREVLLFLRAMPVAMAAQEVRERPLPRVLERVRRMAGRVAVAEPDEAVRAAQRACGRWARWFGGLDSCLTRSLVAGAMLAGRHEVVLHVGFRPTQQGAAAVDGHAWLEVDGEAVELTGLDERHEEPYSSSLQLPMS